VSSDSIIQHELLCNLDDVELSFQALDLRVLRGSGLLQLVYQLDLGQLGSRLLIMLRLLKFVREHVALFFRNAPSLVYSKFPLDLTSIQHGLQLLNLRIVGRGGFL
jgi:hypothetical protein